MSEMDDLIRDGAHRRADRPDDVFGTAERKSVEWPLRSGAAPSAGRARELPMDALIRRSHFNQQPW